MFKYIPFSVEPICILPIKNGICLKDGYKVEYGGRIYPGIMKRLKKKFYPMFKDFNGTSSIRNGILTHHQLEQHVNGERIKRMTKSCKIALSTLEEHRLVPIFSEYPIVSKSRNLSTRLDMICKPQSHDNYIIISYKSGEPKSRKRRKKKDDIVIPTNFPKPLDSIEINSTSIAWLQSCMELAILYYDYNLDYRNNYFILMKDKILTPPQWVKKLDNMKFVYES